ncbi:MAG: PepSY domain-containing protein [Gemmatimonadaceae bacterium]|nr:PepSY domain-containing protein [Gemmatimonadaceae bacterium]
MSLFTQTVCRVRRLVPGHGILPRHAALPCLLTFVAVLQGCRSESVLPTSPAVAPSLSQAALAPLVDDSSWTQLDVDVVITTTLQSGAKHDKIGSRTKKMHAERGRGADGRWYTKYTYPAQDVSRAMGVRRSLHPDVAEWYASDDGTDVRAVLRDGRVVRPMDRIEANPGGIDAAASLSPEMREMLTKAKQEVSGATRPARSPHWLDATIRSNDRRGGLAKRLATVAGTPTTDERGRSVYRHRSNGRTAEVAVDAETGDIEDVEMSDAARGVMRMHVEHAGRAHGRAARSRIRYELTRQSDASSIVTDIVLSNHQVKGGRP